MESNEAQNNLTTAGIVGGLHEEDSVISNLRSTHSALTSVLRSSAAAARDLADTDGSLSIQKQFLSGISTAIAPLQSQNLATKAMNARISQAVTPANSLLRTFSRAKRLERRLLVISSDKGGVGDRNSDETVIYVDCVSRLSAAVASATAECEPVVQRLQDVVEFLGRTKATDMLRIRRLKDAAAALRAVCRKEVQQMRYEGPLDEALVRLQEEYEEMLRRLRHPDVGEDAGAREDELELDQLDRLGHGMDGPDWPSLGAAEEVEVLRRVSETLAANDCLDICIDIFVKVRYRQVAKTLMRLNPDYLKTFEPEDIDRIEWESLDASISLWITHLKVAVHSVLAAEKHLSRAVLSSAMDGAVWPECFAQISDRIMAVFFRFGEGVALSSPEPQKLFRLLDMSAAASRLRPAISLLFEDTSPDVADRFRELQKLLVHASARAFSALESLPDNSSPPPDASVPGVVRYVVNFLKCLAVGTYAPAMAHVLRTESLWKAGFLSRPDPDGSLLRESLARVFDALQLNVEAKRERYRDRVAAHLFAMNSYWYMYMRTRGSDLAKLVGEEEMKKKWKASAEEAAYAYQVEAWGPVVMLLQGEGAAERGEAAGAVVVRGKMDAFMREIEEMMQRHRRGGYKIPEADLREQMKEAVAAMVLPAYKTFLKACAAALQGRAFLPPDALKEMLARLFDGGGAGNTAAETVASPGGRRLRGRRRVDGYRTGSEGF